MIIYVLIIKSTLSSLWMEVGKFPSLVACEQAKAKWYLEADKTSSTGQCVERKL